MNRYLICLATTFAVAVAGASSPSFSSGHISCKSVLSCAIASILRALRALASACATACRSTQSGDRLSALLVVEFDEQILGLSEIGRVEALGKPSIDRRQQIVSFSFPPLIAH